MNKKLSFLIGGLRGGGAERVCVTLANGLAERGYEIDLVVLSLKGAIRNKELSNKVNLINLNVHQARYSMIVLWRYLRKARPKTVLSFNRQISVIVGLLRKLTGLRFRLVSRNIIFLSMSEASKSGVWDKYISGCLIKRFYSLSDSIIAQSYAMKEDLLTYIKIPENSVQVIQNPLSKEVENYNKFVDVKRKDYVLCVGRLETQKAFHYAINSFSVIAEEYPRLRLKIVGDGSLKFQLIQLAQDLGVSDRVDFEGFQPEMIPYYLEAKATLLTSIFEGFPNVLVESIALGTPVVAFNCPSGPSEIIVDGVNGYLVPYKDEIALVNTLRKVLTIDLPREEVCLTARAYESNAILDRYEDLLGA